MQLCAVTEPYCNNLLAALPAEVKQRLLPSLEPCYLKLGKVLYESGKPVSHIYFPTEAVVSLSYVTVTGNSSEISLVGKEGVVGIARFLGGNSSHTTDVVQIAGNALRISSRDAMAEFALRSEFMVLVLRYIQALMTQMSQTAACNRHHRVDQQLCRLLLLALDRVPTKELFLTQEMIANMLGVRREGVTEAACKLQELGVIEYSRGRIRVHNRERLELLSCECYQVVKRESDRLLSFNRGSTATQLNTPRRRTGAVQTA